MNMNTDSTSRRKFLATSAAAATGFMILPRHVLGGRGHVSANEKLNVAGIGFGGKGRSDLSALKEENIVALCDVDHHYGARTIKMNPKAVLYHDYRLMLEKEKSIDAVMIATPDHTHALIAMAAIQARNHCCCHVPLTHLRS